MVIVSLSLPDDLVKDMDRLIQARGYKGRSELSRAALRAFLAQHKEEDELKGRVNAIVVLGYPEHAEKELSEIRHAHNDLITSMLHAHTKNGRCATILVAEGVDDAIKRFFAELRGMRELESLEVTVLS